MLTFIVLNSLLSIHCIGSYDAHICEKIKVRLDKRIFISKAYLTFALPLSQYIFHIFQLGIPSAIKAYV